jgi:phosphatidylglycerol:prolipoprotein diacylglycerol transferase
MTFADVFSGGAYAVGLGVFWWASRGRGTDTDGMLKVAIAALLGGFLGAKLGQWIFSEASFSTFFSSTVGKSLFGGILFGWVAASAMKKKLGINRSTGDQFALALCAGEAFGRIGCLLHQCCFGIPWDGPWAIMQHNALRHPTQIYSLVSALLILAILLGVKTLKQVEGRQWIAYVGLFGISRGVIEFFREGPRNAYGITTVQIFCVGLVVFAMMKVVTANRRDPMEKIV